MGKKKNTQKNKGGTAVASASTKPKVGAEWKSYVVENEGGYYDLQTEDTGDVVVRLFLTPALLEETEETLYSQIVNATRFPGVKLVAITPDTHYGYGVPVGSVILTDGTVAMGPVGFDIGCFTGDTLVPTADGQSYSLKHMAEIGEEFYVYSITDSQHIVVSKATCRKTRENASLLRVVLDNDREIICTPDHEFMLRDGSYTQAQYLTPRTSLMPLYKRIVKDGYVAVRHPANGKEQRVHWIMARSGLFGQRPSFPGQRTVIHHQNFTPSDNRPCNLVFMGDQDHVRFHRSVNIGPHFQTPEFEAQRIAGIKAYANTEAGYADYAQRGTKNIRAYMQERPEHFKAAVAGNGQRGKKYLTAYAQSEKGRQKSSEVGRSEMICDVCGAKVPGGGFGIKNHRRREHGYNHKVTSIEVLGRTEDVYCLTVPEYGNFALDAGVFVHNCGMVAARSSVPASEATPKKRLEFNRAVIERVGMGLGHGSKTSMRDISEPQFQELIRGGAEYYIREYGEPFSRARAERNRIPVDDSWEVPKGSKAMRGMSQLGTLGSGNHFAELQECLETGTLSVQVHSGSRGFGHGLAEWYFSVAKKERPDEITHLDLGYFTPDSPHYRDYLNAVAAGGNYAIINRLILFSEISRAFRRVFGSELELIYEISHNLVQAETHPEFGDVWVHRKGATRAFPAGHPALAGTIWAEEGHPVLIPGSNCDFSYILRPMQGAVKSGYSVNHGAGRRMSRGTARRELSQKGVNAQYKEAGIIVNDNDDVPLDESDACYKSSKEVIEAVVRAGLARVEYTFWPLASLKGIE